MPMSLALVLALIGTADGPAETHPFASKKYGIAVDLPAPWTLAESEHEDRVFVALIDGSDPKRPGAAVCEIGLAPESLDAYKTRIDGNAARRGEAGRLVSNKVVKVGDVERLETLREFRPGFGGVWSEWTVRLVANRQLYTFILNADEKTFPTTRPQFDRLVAGSKFSLPNTGADRLTGNRWLQREFKFSLELPEGWSPVLAPSEVALLYANGKARGVWSDNVLVLAHEHRPLDLESLAKSFPDQLRAADPNCEVLACSVVRRGEVKMLETVVKTKRGPFLMTILERRFRGERFDYELKYTVESDRFDTLAPTLRKSLDSFKEAPGAVARPGKGKAA